jgi:hypothetical protein
LGGIRPAELAAIGGRLEGFAAEVFESLPRKDQRARGQCYLRGLMLDGRRKSIEPMAARLGEVHYQALHHFVAVSPWDWRPVRRRLAERLVDALDPIAWAVDDTGFPKDGDHSVGVQGQYCGTLGKTANCQLGVSVNAVTEPASCPLDWRLFLPERWDEEAMALGARPATCPTACTIGRSGSWCWTWWMSSAPGTWCRRCWSPTLATARSVSSAKGWTTVRSPMWCRSRPTPAPTPSRLVRRSRRTRARVAVPGRATATSPPRSSSSPWQPGCRPAWS